MPSLGALFPLFSPISSIGPFPLSSLRSVYHPPSDRFLYHYLSSVRHHPTVLSIIRQFNHESSIISSFPLSSASVHYHLYPCGKNLYTRVARKPESIRQDARIRAASLYPCGKETRIRAARSPHRCGKKVYIHGCHNKPVIHPSGISLRLSLRNRTPFSRYPSKPSMVGQYRTIQSLGQKLD